MIELEKTASICPTCHEEGIIEKIDAKIIEENGKVYIVKECKKHGSFKEIYFGDVSAYNKWMKYKVTGETVPDVKTKVFDEPAMYNEHKSQSVLTTLIVTNRSDVKCNNSCFMNADEAGHVYEPNLDQIRDMLLQARTTLPVGSNALQITGGEPTIREDLFDIIMRAKEVGFSHVQINTNGLKISENVEYCEQLKKVGVNTIYLNFDGVTRDTNKLIDFNKNAIANLRRADLKIALIAVLTADKNLHESGKIIRFAINNMDVIRSINFRPVSFNGKKSKLSHEERNEQRLDYIKIFEVIEKEFDGQISRDDFYPVSAGFPISKLLLLFKGETQIEFTAHPCCGGATYIFIDNGEPIPFTRFIDIEGMRDFIDKESRIVGPLKKIRIASAFLKDIDKFIDYDKAPSGFELKKIIKDAAVRSDYSSLRVLRNKSLLIESMWFQDAFNLDANRLQRCVIHYTTPEGIVPSCSYENLGIGNKILEKYSISIEEWEKKTGKKIKDDFIEVA